MGIYDIADTLLCLEYFRPTYKHVVTKLFRKRTLGLAPTVSPPIQTYPYSGQFCTISVDIHLLNSKYAKISVMIILLSVWSSILSLAGHMHRHRNRGEHQGHMSPPQPTGKGPHIQSSAFSYCICRCSHAFMRCFVNYQE